MAILPPARTHAVERPAVGRDLGWAVWGRGRSLAAVERLEDGITGAAGLDPEDCAVAVLLCSLVGVIVGVATLPRRTDQRIAGEQQGVVMRLVAKTVVLAGRERI